MKRLFEINTNSLGESYVRAYAWAENEDVAVLMFRSKYPQFEFISVRPLFAADSPTFITEASDSGFELELNLVEPAQAFGVVGSTIRLRSGRYLDLLDPRPDQFTFADIAGALSKVCRFGGQIDSFYSVAEHSIHCAHQTKLDGNGDAAQAAVLLHDAAKAFIGDVVKPLKLILGPPYAELERRIEAVIEQKFAVDFARHKAYIREIDHAMLIHERRNLFSPDSVEWVGERDVRKIDDAVCLHCWDPAHAEAIFTQAARWLGIEVGQ